MRTPRGWKNPYVKNHPKVYKADSKAQPFAGLKAEASQLG
jgi:hypothetical protein